MPRYYTMKEAVERLKVTHMTVWRYTKKLNIEPRRSRFDRREYALSQMELDLLHEAIHGSPQPEEE